MNRIPPASLKRYNDFMLRPEWKGFKAGFDARVYATESVPIDSASIRELDVLPLIEEAALSVAGGLLTDAAFTPDFHKGSGIPIGTVLHTEGVVFPKAAGNDIGCGMALCALDVKRDEFISVLPMLKPMLRHAFYEGGRDIPLSPEGREAILRYGIEGLTLCTGHGGILEGMTEEMIMAHAFSSEIPSLPTSDLWSFSDYVKGSGGVSRDSQIGSLSGGNHFLEFGYVAERTDREFMHRNRLGKDCMTILAHNGSVGFGTSVGTFYQHAAAEEMKGIRRPSHGFIPLSLNKGQKGHEYLNAMGLAANFAAVNRIVLLRMAAGCLKKALGRDVVITPVLDSPHNMVWAGETNGVWNALHRKGAAGAGEGHAVIVPGSSGTASLLFTGLGCSGTRSSAPHGAGRAVRRSRAEEDTVRREGEVLPPVSPENVRADIAVTINAALRQEEPRQYKPIEAIGETVEKAGIGTRAGELRPVLTLKRT